MSEFIFFIFFWSQWCSSSFLAVLKVFPFEPVVCCIWNLLHKWSFSVSPTSIGFGFHPARCSLSLTIQSSFFYTLVINANMITLCCRVGVSPSWLSLLTRVSCACWYSKLLGKHLFFSAGTDPAALFLADSRIYILCYWVLTIIIIICLETMQIRPWISNKYRVIIVLRTTTFPSCTLMFVHENKNWKFESDSVYLREQRWSILTENSQLPTASSKWDDYIWIPWKHFQVSLWTCF